MARNAAGLPGTEQPAGYVKIDLGKDPMSIWSNLRTPDPRRTKAFDRGGFKGTAIAPLHIAERMTMIFGPVGLGWGFDINQIDYVPADKPEVVYVLVTVWWKLDGVTNKGGNPDGRATFQHVGGTMLQKGGKNGIRYDDEAVKAAVTDAVGKALSYLGAGADVHLGLFDDSKYLKAATDVFTSSTSGVAPTAPEGENAEDNKAAAEAELEAWRKNILGQLASMPDKDESMTLLKGLRQGALPMLEKLGEDHPVGREIKDAIVAKRKAILEAAG